MKSILLTLLLSPIFCFGQTDTIVYSLVSADLIKGHTKIWQHADGAYETWYQFNDRGRGDSLRTIFRETADGIPINVRASGVDYMKNPVFEEYNLENNLAVWKNPAEEGKLVIQGKAFYTGLKSESGHIVKALHANGNKLQLLPFGEVELNILEHHELKQGPVPVKLTLVAIKGFSYTPLYLWVDEDYIDFANVNEWMSSIRQGYETTINELLAIQKKYELAHFSQLAANVPDLDASVLIQNVNVFNAKEARTDYGMDVLLNDGIITAIVPTKTNTHKVATIIDGTGKTLLPGLWDMHTHTADIMEGVLQMACGVTHIRDMGNSELLLDKKRQFENGELIGPRIEVISGLIDATGPMAAPTGALISSLDDGLQSVRDFASKGYQQIKLYSSIKPEWVKPLADEAHKHNLRVCGHIPAFMTATTAIHSGFDEITHMNMLALNFFGDTIDTRNPMRFSIPARYTAGLDLQGKEFLDFIQLLKTHDIALDPTLSIFEMLFTAKDKVVSPVFGASVNHFPLNVQRYYKAGGGGIPVPEGMYSTYHASFKAFKQMLKVAFDNHIPILPGTDSYPGFSLFRELELYVDAGIPAERVLQLATWNTAVYTGMQNDFGSIEVGRKADMLMIDGDPVKNISNIRRTKLVITNNKLYEPNKLFAGISISPF